MFNTLYGFRDVEPIFETPKIHSKENYERFLPTGKPPIHIDEDEFAKIEELFF